MELTNSDSLRLNVLMAQSPKAVRIDDGKMTLYALTSKGEAKIELQPTGKDEPYLRLVREFLSLKATGSSGGYPIFIRRWTRTGNKQQNIDALLLLGEHEAVVSAAYADDVSVQQAEHIWWCVQSTEVAIQLLRHDHVIKHPLGKTLADFLIEFLPFEEQQLNVANIIRCCLQGDLLDQDSIERLWNRGKRKQAIYVGFLYAEAEKIPLQLKPHPAHTTLQALQQQHPDNPYINDSLKLSSPTGQKWLTALAAALSKPVDQDVVTATFLAVEAFLHQPKLREDGKQADRGERELSDAIAQSQLPYLHQLAQADLAHALKTIPSDMHDSFSAAVLLMQLGEDSLIPYFAGNDSVGSVMRKRLKPIIDATQASIKQLLA